MKVAIYDLVHLDWIVPYTELLADTQIEVHFYVSKDFKEDIEEATDHNIRFHWYFVEVSQGQIPSFIKFYNFLSEVKPDLVILNSIEGKHLSVYLSLLLARTERVLINVHSINNFLNTSFSFPIKKLIRTLSKRILNLKVNGYIVNAEAMQEFILKNNLTSKPTYWLPPVYNKINSYEYIYKGHVVFLIPGAIDERRRDYNLALEVFALMAKENAYVKLIIAGRPVGVYGHTIQGKANELIQKGMKIEYYKSEVPERKFQNMVARAAIIFSPLVLSTVIHDKIEEKYGLTKSSGNIYDAIRHGKPLIVPDYIKVPKEIESSCIFYSSSNDLYLKMLELINDKNLLESYIHRAKVNSSAFSKEMIQNRLLRIISDKTL